jgi:hypothetical protein
MKTKDSKNSSWVIYREYRDAIGNIHTEYKDTEGNIHFYTNGSSDSQLAEEYGDRNISKGLLMGVIVTCVVGLTAGTIYFLTKLNNPPPVPVSVINTTDKATPAPSPPAPQVKIVEKPIITIVPVPQAQKSDSTVNVTANPSASNPSSKQENVNTVKPSEKSGASVPKPIVVTPKDSVTTTTTTTTTPTPTPTKTDSDLKTEILKQFQNNLANNKLTVEVKNGQVTISGTVTTPEQLQQIQPLLKSIQGIKKADVNATVASKVSDTIKDIKDEVKKVID